MGEELNIALPNQMLDYQIDGKSIGKVARLVDTGIYPVKLVDYNHCEILDTLILVNRCPYYIIFPNSFTPNGDYLNDVFRAKAEHILEFNLIIYDRWGAVVFKSDDVEFGWDGRIKGEPAQQGAYMYRCSFSFPDGNVIRRENVKGSVHLLH
ncbi:MAG: gliding motility-associated C-terminal domain-containing protein, partial [Bacteroidota bacterium]|nr:gliding motility-associated C-terminal domain-containing protein [Bacteroidota bacterium]MDX5430771.1 gliding motility-associated C-terminal domain-containing protein [Bacteroidota bacterium]MDX5469516.1 gliding motility-associated C-terminal domain-containing protein [Bacteroidota bacterium]